VAPGLWRGEVAGATIVPLPVARANPPRRGVVAHMGVHPRIAASRWVCSAVARVAGIAAPALFHQTQRRVSSALAGHVLGRMPGRKGIPPPPLALTLRTPPTPTVFCSAKPDPFEGKVAGGGGSSGGGGSPRGRSLSLEAVMKERGKARSPLAQGLQRGRRSPSVGSLASLNRHNASGSLDGDFGLDFDGDGDGLDSGDEAPLPHVRPGTWVRRRGGGVKCCVCGACASRGH
jgi:hypothetical protein